ncbi:MAG: hypothetical protein Q9220_007262 [cf. Caloplaca sp. 1 TL-2023]
MSNMDEQTAAMTNRSLRTIRTELEYLTDARLITPTQLTSLLSQLPSQTALSAPLASPSPVAAPPISSTPGVGNLASHLKNTLLSSSSEKKSASSDTYFSSPQPTPIPAPTSAAMPPPAYSHIPNKTLASASALYEYMPSDAGDLALLPNDRVSITEFMNADWAKGRNERTGQEGIFPRSYVQILDGEKSAAVAGAQQQPASSGYGNVPLEVASQSGPSTGAASESKFNQQGKKFGKKMGNAAIFGAGATIGSNIVNGIF